MDDVIRRLAERGEKEDVEQVREAKLSSSFAGRGTFTDGDSIRESVRGSVRGKHRAPDPTTMGNRKGITTVNLKRKQQQAQEAEIKEEAEKPRRRTLFDVMKTLRGGKKKKKSMSEKDFHDESGEIRRTLTQRVSDSLKRSIRSSANSLRSKGKSGSPRNSATPKTNGPFKANPNFTQRTGQRAKKRGSPKVDDEEDEPSSPKLNVMKIGTLMKGLYKKSSGGPKNYDDDENYDEGPDMGGAAALASSDTRFQTAIETKYGGIGRKNSSFSLENPMILMLGKSRSGKSTFFKQFMSFAGEPPNYARAYISTKAPVEKEVEVDGYEMMVVDVGGSQKDILDWRFYLSSAEVVIFMVAVDEFAKPSKESKKRSELHEALDLFDSILHNVALLNSKIILVLNKIDVFAKVITNRNITVASSGFFEGAPSSTDVNENLAFIEKLFQSKIDDSEHDVIVEKLSAIESNSCKDVVSDLCDRLQRGKEVTKWKNLL